jgi:hypothetical protein
MDTKIASAFVKAQKEFGPALKTSTNPHFKNRYADLSACIEAVIDALNNNGIGLIQMTHECDSGVIVETVFVHESGETLSAGKLHVPASKSDAQGYGSSLTYCRRYSLMAACGIAPEDDDGEAARKAPTQRKPTQADTQKVFDAFRDSIEAAYNRKQLTAIWDLVKPSTLTADQKNELLALIKTRVEELKQVPEAA